MFVIQAIAQCVENRKSEEIHFLNTPLGLRMNYASSLQGGSEMPNSNLEWLSSRANFRLPGTYGSLMNRFW